MISALRGDQTKIPYMIPALRYAMQSQHLVVILESAASNRKMTRAKQAIDDMDQMHHAFNLLI